MLLSFALKNETTRANLNKNKRILELEPFWPIRCIMARDSTRWRGSMIEQYLLITVLRRRREREAKRKRRFWIREIFKNQKSLKRTIRFFKSFDLVTDNFSQFYLIFLTLTLSLLFWRPCWL